MGFFKDLKKRIFTLKIDNEEPKKKDTRQVDLKNLEFENESFKSKYKGVKKHDSFSLPASVENIFKIREEKKRQRKKIQEQKTNKYLAGLKKSGNSFSHQLNILASRHNTLDEAYFDDLEEVLIMADISVNLVLDIIDEIKLEVKKENIQKTELINEIIADKLFIMYTNQSHLTTQLNLKSDRLNIILMIGTNGSGKTTSIAKLANTLVNDGQKVLVAAADTFRAAAVEQIEIWTKRAGCDLVKSPRLKSDPASVIFDAIKKGDNEKYDVLIIDTAGRLQNKDHLMRELHKMNKIIKNYDQDAPHETFLVLDATIGQNGISQVENFKKISDITGIILTKMDGTSKGGIIFSIMDLAGIPVKFLGLGEKIDDLLEFDLDRFIYGLTKGLIDEQ